MQYIASPYSHKDPMMLHARFMSVAEHASFLLKRDIIVFSPILHCHYPAMTFGLPKGIDFWRDYDKEMISHCEAVRVLMLEGWKTSRGVTFEIEEAQRLGIKIFYDEFCKESTSYFQNGYEIGVDLADKEEVPPKA